MENWEKAELLLQIRELRDRAECAEARADEAEGANESLCDTWQRMKDERDALRDTAERFSRFCVYTLNNILDDCKNDEHLRLVIRPQLKRLHEALGRED